MAAGIPVGEGFGEEAEFAYGALAFSFYSTKRGKLVITFR